MPDRPQLQKRDVFLSHASPDKEKYVYPFIEALNTRGISYWVDEGEVLWGDSISRKINEGLIISTYVVVFLSMEFLNRNWPRTELESALSHENTKGQVVVFPILIASKDEVF